jgi:hypothetical protein
VTLADCFFEKRYSVYFLSVSKALAERGVERGDGIVMINDVRIKEGHRQVNQVWGAAAIGPVKLTIFKNQPKSSSMNVIELEGPTFTDIESAGV